MYVHTYILEHTMAHMEPKGETNEVDLKLPFKIVAYRLHSIKY